MQKYTVLFNISIRYALRKFALKEMCNFISQTFYLNYSRGH